MSDTSGSKAQDYESVLKGSDTRVAGFEVRHRSPLDRVQHFLHGNPTMVPVIVLVVSVIAFGFIAGDRFFHPFNLSLIIQQVSVIGILAAAQSLVILTAGIDLSVAAIMVLCSVVMGKFATDLGIPTPIAIVLGFVLGTACGLMNGYLVTLLRLPPFIVTLGTWNIFFSLNLWYSGAQSIRSQDIDAEAPLLKFFGENVGFFGAQFTYGSFLMIAIFVVLWYMLTRTAWGRHVYAVGDDKEAAELAGIRTDRTLISVYALAGLVCAIGAWAAIGRVGSVSPQSFYEGNLQSITAVVIGGISLFGGRGSIIGPLVGALIVGVFQSGLRLAGVDVLWQVFAIGWLIILAVAIDQWIRRVCVMSDVAPIVQGRGIVKRYGHVTAINGSDFDLLPGEILAVIGDNGAGKSSIVKAICGAVTPDEGEIRIEGKPVHFSSPIEAREMGIEIVYQTLALSPALSIADNMFAGREIRKKGWMGDWFRMLDKKEMERFARDKLTELGLMTVQSITQPVETLSGGQRQGVAVARAAAFATKFIIMDEPTAALGVKESRRVLELILDVKARGIPIILISHNMPHVFEVADRIHVHRLGRRLCIIDPKAYSMSDAVAFMTGAKEPPAETVH